MTDAMFPTRNVPRHAVACHALWVIYEQFALLGHQQWREKPGFHAPQTKVHCLQADEREATALHPAKKSSPKTFHSCQPCPPTRIYTESWPQGGSKTETARRPQKQDRQRISFWKKRGCQNGPKNGTAARSHFCDRSKQNPARQALAALPVAHPRARMPLAPLTPPALAIPCSWPAICIEFCLTPLTSAKSAHAAIQLPRPLDRTMRPEYFSGGPRRDVGRTSL